MADKKHVPLEIFLTALKAQSSQIIELTVSVLVLRAALMQANQVPIPADELKRLDTVMRELPRIRSARKAIGQLDVDTSEALTRLLKNFQGPIQ